MRFRTIRLVAMLALLCWSAGMTADSVCPFPDVNPYDYYGNMMVSVKVTRGAEVLQDVIVAVYSDSEIRGKGTPQDPGNPGVSYLTVYGNKTGEEIYFRVYDKSDGFTYEIDNGQTYRYNGNLGSPLNPYELALDNADKSIILTESTGVSNLTTAGDVSFQRSFTQGKASTICLPFAMTEVDGGKVYSFTGIDYDDEQKKWVATMTDATPDSVNINSTIPNTPYLFMPEITGLVSFCGRVDDLPDDITASSTISNDGDWTFWGTYSRLDYGKAPMTGLVYGFAAKDKIVDGHDIVAGQFIRAKEGAYLPAFRAYLTYTGNDDTFRAPSRDGGQAGYDLPDRIIVRLVNRSETVTAVGTIDTKTGAVTIEKWFDLSGRAIEGEPQRPGIYLNNRGKKTVIK